VKDYDYHNKGFVESSADDWNNYPNLTGVKTQVNCETWGGPNYHRNYLKWWFARLPRSEGVNPAKRAPERLVGVRVRLPPNMMRMDVHASHWIQVRRRKELPA
jgi:hypothetical protein